MTKQDVIARADAICQTAFRAVRLIHPPAINSGSLAPLATYLAKVVPIVDREVAELAGLKGPAANRALFSRYVAALRASATDYRVLERAARRSDPAGVADASAQLRASPAAALAARYGLSACARSGDTVGSS